MSVVVDASVLVAALVDAGPHGEWAERILTGGSLHVPELALVEATNTLRRLERSKAITTPVANAAYDDLIRLSIERCSFEAVADRIWALRHNLTSYDASYVAVAEALELPLATLDLPMSKTKGLNCDFLTPPIR